MPDLTDSMTEIKTKNGESIVLLVERIKKGKGRIFLTGTRCIIRDDQVIVPSNVPKISLTLTTS